MMSETLLKVKDLRTYFYTDEGVVKALEGVDFEVVKGSTMGLVGETGCGKSVTARSILRLVESPGKIVSGEVWFEKKNLLEVSNEEIRKIRGKEIAMVFQDPLTYLNPVFTIGNQIKEVIVLHQNLKKVAAREKTLEMLKLVKMPHPERVLDQYPHELSGGMRQRAQIAMMLSCQPKMFIADEATTFLDVTIQAQILKLLNELKEKLKTSVIFITHNLGIVAQVCDYTCVMYAGRVVEFSDVKTIFHNPLHPYLKGLLNAIPKLYKKTGKFTTIPGTVPNLINPPSGCRFHPRCSKKMEICRKERPPEVEVETGHKVACYLYA